MITLLIITEDIVKIQTLTGILGKSFSFVYLNWLKIRLKIIIFCLNPFFDLTIVASDYFKIKNKCLTYGDLLARTNYSQNRLKYLQIVDSVFKDQDISLFKTRLISYLVYHYFIYAKIYQKILNQVKPKLVLTLGNSYHEQTARFISKSKHVQIKNFPLFSLNIFHRILKNFLLNREYQLKINNFLNQAKKNRPSSLVKSKNINFLSLDFHRHLKTLAPIYKILEENNKTPVIITDILNLESSLLNFNIPSANHLYLASFLPENTIRNLSSLKVKATKSVKKLKLIKEIDLDSYLFNLTLKTSKLILKHSLVLTQLYQQAAANLFKAVKPKKIVAVSDVRFCELSLCQQAKNNNISSLLVSPNQLLDLAEINPYNTTDIVTVVGSYIKKQLIKQGLKQEKIKVIGDTQSEHSISLLKHNLKNKDVYKTLGINPKMRIILLISFRSTWMIPKDEKKAFIQMASQAVKKIPNSVLVIKPHPTEKRYRIIDELNEWGIFNAIVSDNNKLELYHLLNSCKVVLQTWSMTIFEAIMAKRPVISVNPYKKDYGLFIPILNQGGAVVVTSQPKLNYWLKTLLNNQPIVKQQLAKAQKVIAHFVRPPDGRAVQRVLKLLE